MTKSNARPKRLGSGITALATALLCAAVATPAAATWQQVASVYSNGHTPYVNRNDPNDVVLAFNNANVWGDITELSATIVHDGFLQSASHGLDHMAISVRGASMDGLFPYLGLGSGASTYFGLGEQVGASAPWSEVAKAISGRGPTLWPAGTALCGNTSQPCLIYENYTVNLNGPGLICQGGSSCGYAVPVPVSAAPFHIAISADDWDVTTVIHQNGRVVANVSCRALTGNDDRCGAQAGDQAYGDAFIGNVVRHTGTGSSGRRLGATNINVRLLREQYTCSPYYFCQIP